MAAQESTGKRSTKSPHEQDEERTASPIDTSALDADVDAILDEIDEVLEENAEDFVKSFVQKGGQ
jgi:ubiquitin-like protein Pup